MKIRTSANLTLLLSTFLMSMGSALASLPTVGLTASPFQKPASGDEVVVAVVVNPADGVTSMDLVYHYDPALLVPTGVYPTGYTNSFSLTSSTATLGTVQIHLAGPAPLAGSGEVAWVQFHVQAAAGATTALSWASASLNGGAISCETKNLSLTIGSAPVKINSPVTAQGAPLTQVLIPISASAFTGGSSFDLSVTFNPAVLSAVSVQTTPLTSCMTAASNVTMPGTVNVALYGLCTVSGSGPLVKIKFNVVGPLGSRTPLNVTRGAINEEHVGTVLGDGMFFSCETADRDGDGYSTCAGDCDDSNGLRHPGATESCNGADDNCDGIVDNVAMPQGVPRLIIGKQIGASTLSWSAVSGAAAYDVVRGSLATLAVSNGDFTTSTDLCLGNDLTSTQSSDASTPAAGAGYWYLVRPENCGGFGSFDGDDPGQVAPRDAEIANSPSSCP